MRTLYVVQKGSLFVGWWDQCPPAPDSDGRCPSFRAPDIYHDRVTGCLEDVLGTFADARILPPRNEYAIGHAAPEWVRIGLLATKATRTKKRIIKPNPEVGGLFSPDAVAITHHREPKEKKPMSSKATEKQVRYALFLLREKGYSTRYLTHDFKNLGASKQELRGVLSGTVSHWLRSMDVSRISAVIDTLKNNL